MQIYLHSCTGEDPGFFNGGWLIQSATIKTYRFFKKKRFNGTLLKLELCKAVIKNGGKRKARWISKSNLAGKNSKTRLNFSRCFRLTIISVFGLAGFTRYPRISIFWGTHVCISFFHVLDFYGGLLRRGVASHPIHPPWIRPCVDSESFRAARPRRTS